MKLFRCLVVLLALWLAGCGYRLARELSLPAELAVLQIEAPDPQGELAQGLRRGLERAGARIVGDGQAMLRISKAELQQRPLTVSAGGRVQEFELVYQVEFSLLDATGKAHMNSAMLELRRDYSFDTAQALGSPGEDELLRSELERDMAQAILRRIDAALR